MTRYVWLLVGVAIFGCKRDADRSPAEPVLGCYSIEQSNDPRFPKGDRLCLLPNGIVSITDGSRSADAFEVSWTAPEGGFRAIVPSARTKGAYVEFLVTRADGDKLDFRSGGNWMSARLGSRTEPAGQEALDGLRACWTCVDDAVREQAITTEGTGPLYSLRACSSFLRAAGAKCSALGLEARKR